MTVHANDRALLARLIKAAEGALAAPLMSATYGIADLGVLAGDLDAALRCPSPRSPIGTAETILFAALSKISIGGAITTGELYRFCTIAQHALPMVRDHYFETVAASARGRS